MLVTLAFAQSLDGSIAARPGERTVLSGPVSMAYTHGLRARHDAILVGVGTVVADNPRLTVRLVNGPNPQPVVLDSALRIPLDCALIATPARPLWVLCAADAPDVREQALIECGVRVLRASWPATAIERWPHVLGALEHAGIASLMIEGGARVISSALMSGCVDRLSVTIAPRLLGGLRAVDAQSAPLLPALRDVRYERFGDDMVLEATLAR
jgi:GTP cyclohydrolase II